jgi:hypothetical protein
MMAVELEAMEERFSERGEAAPSALDLYIRASGNQRRLLETLGLQRRARDITPFAARQSSMPLRKELDAEIVEEAPAA